MKRKKDCLVPEDIQIFISLQSLPLIRKEGSGFSLYFPLEAKYNFLDINM